MSIVENIRVLCKEANTSIPKLEKELGFGNGAIYNWDKNSPSIDKIQKVADRFNVSINHVIYGDDDIHTIAAHHDGEEWTEEELEEIQRFKEFIRMKRTKDKQG
ncbi:hypothetical protein J6TS7_44450 [Paenibacillus dendritiformis]|uniref:helix-turn-helix domain-containing protein n=1 Tax=Paenibacillus TaxID=44249 RepID=UPI001AFED2DA|nr:helix-turn-helix transcriptional regulator [Paenibacillus dendritiformis]GIO80835.1 hypothetical protein J6TS7_44450 [Paenibacillus dendritiformis]